MSVLCFGTFFTLLICNKIDWDKGSKKSISNRVLYGALFDIVDKRSAVEYHVSRAKVEASDYTDDAVSRVKWCKDSEIAIQRAGNRERYLKRFQEDHSSVLCEFVDFISKYLDETQLERLARSIIELIINSADDSDILHIGSTFGETMTKKEIVESNHVFNLPALLAGVLYYIFERNIPNKDGKSVVRAWEKKYKEILPPCPTGKTIPFEIEVLCEAPVAHVGMNEASDASIKKKTLEITPNHRKSMPQNNLRPQNPAFRGRDDELVTIYRNFHNGGAIPPIQILTGLSGVGKSQLATKYAYNHLSEYDVVWHLTAGTTEAIFQSVDDFVAKNYQDEYNKLHAIDNRSPIIHAFREWFEKHDSWLLIFDNVEDVGVIEPFLPRNASGHILLTTQLTTVSFGKHIKVDVIDESTAMSFLSARTKINDEANASILAERLGYLPLALEQAGAYIANVPDMDYIKYLSRLDRYGLKVFGSHKDSVNVTWKVTMDKIKMESAKQLLYLCSYFAPERILFSLFVGVADGIADLLPYETRVDDMPEPLCFDLVDELKQDQIILELTKYSLMRFENGMFYIHRLLQEVVRDEIKDNDCYIKCCANMIIWISTKQFIQTDTIKDIMKNWAHCVSVITHARPFFENNIDLWDNKYKVYYQSAFLMTAAKLSRLTSNQEAIDIMKNAGVILDGKPLVDISNIRIDEGTTLPK